MKKSSELDFWSRKKMRNSELITFAENFLGNKNKIIHSQKFSPIFEGNQKLFLFDFEKEPLKYYESSSKSNNFIFDFP